LSHHDQQASDDQNQTEHGQMLSSNMLLLNLILLIDVTFSTPTPHYTHNQKTGLNSARFQLFRFHTHLFDHIFLFCRPCAGHVSVLHEQFLLCIHVFCGVEFFYIGLMP